jgi:ABC-type branched-subunit amino acid transport system permease subunit
MTLPSPGPSVDRAPPGPSWVRSLLLAIAATWLLLHAFSRIDDTTAGLISLVHALAFGLALVAVALIDWRRFRWWWLVVALVVVAVVWTSTGHPLLFLVGV